MPLLFYIYSNRYPKFIHDECDRPRYPQKSHHQHRRASRSPASFTVHQGEQQRDDFSVTGSTTTAAVPFPIDKLFAEISPIVPFSGRPKRTPATSGTPPIVAEWACGRDDTPSNQRKPQMHDTSYQTPFGFPPSHVSIGRKEFDGFRGGSPAAGPSMTSTPISRMRQPGSKEVPTKTSEDQASTSDFLQFKGEEDLRLPHVKTVEDLLFAIQQLSDSTDIITLVTDYLKRHPELTDEQKLAISIAVRTKDEGQQRRNITPAPLRNEPSRTMEFGFQQQQEEERDSEENRLSPLSQSASRLEIAEGSQASSNESAQNTATTSAADFSQNNSKKKIDAERKMGNKEKEEKGERGQNIEPRKEDEQMRPYSPSDHIHEAHLAHRKILPTPTAEIPKEPLPVPPPLTSKVSDQPTPKIKGMADRINALPMPPTVKKQPPQPIVPAEGQKVVSSATAVADQLSLRPPPPPPPPPPPIPLNSNNVENNRQSPSPPPPPPPPSSPPPPAEETQSNKSATMPPPMPPSSANIVHNNFSNMAMNPYMVVFPTPAVPPPPPPAAPPTVQTNATGILGILPPPPPPPKLSDEEQQQNPHFARLLGSVPNFSTASMPPPYPPCPRPFFSSPNCAPAPQPAGTAHLLNQFQPNPLSQTNSAEETLASKASVAAGPPSGIFSDDIELDNFGNEARFGRQPVQPRSNPLQMFPSQQLNSPMMNQQMNQSTSGMGFPRVMGNNSPRSLGPPGPAAGRHFPQPNQWNFRPPHIGGSQPYSSPRASHIAAPPRFGHQHRNPTPYDPIAEALSRREIHHQQVPFHHGPGGPSPMVRQPPSHQPQHVQQQAIEVEYQTEEFEIPAGFGLPTSFFSNKQRWEDEEGGSGGMGGFGQRGGGRGRGRGMFRRGTRF